MIVEVEEAMENMQFSVALAAIWKFVSRTNKYIDETTPWAAVKDEARQEELARTMNYLAESLRIIAVALQPFLTETPSQFLVKCRNRCSVCRNGSIEILIDHRNSTV